jgi:flavin-binding protein dodecin
LGHSLPIEDLDGLWPFRHVRNPVDLALGLPNRHNAPERKEDVMAESVYKVIELVGSSTESWEKAAAAAITKASKSLRDLRIAEVSQLDMQLEGGKVRAYRAKVRVSFKYGDKD